MNSTGKLYTTFSLMKKINNAVLTVSVFEDLFEKMFERMFEKMITKNNDVLMHKVHDEIETSNHLLKREIRDEMHSVVNGAVAASERRMIAHMDQKIDTAISGSEGRMIKRIDSKGDAILEAIDEIILPQVETNRLDILLIKQSLSMA